MLLQAGLLFISIVGLYFGAEFALESGERIGKKLGLSPLVIGLLIIGFGTSLPELFVSQVAAFNGEYLIATGNVMGSNVANSFLVLGICALITPLALTGGDLKVQIIIFSLVHLFFIISVNLLGFNLWSGIGYMVFFLIYMFITIKQSADDNEKDEDEDEKIIIKATDYLKLFFGFLLLYLAGELLVKSGSELGRLAGISTYVISAIFVAFGTSFPELVTGVLSCIKKKETDLIIGNIIGSNIFNLALVLGSVSFYSFEAKDTYLPEAISLILFSLLLFFLNFRKGSINRVLGTLFLCVYVGMAVYWIKQ